MPENAAPQAGDAYLRFNGRDAYVEIPSIDDYSVSTTGELTVSVWMRPDTLNFPSVERNAGYIHWLGKGDASAMAVRSTRRPGPTGSASTSSIRRVAWGWVVTCKFPSTRENGFIWSGSPTAREPTVWLESFS